MNDLLVLIVTIWPLAAGVGVLFGTFALIDAVDDEEKESAARIILSGLFFPIVLPFILYILFKKANLLPGGIKWH